MKFNLEKAEAILERTPRVVRNLLSDLPDEWTHKNEGDDTWSAYDVVGHLIHGEQTDWIPRAQIILGNNQNKTFVPFDRFAQFKKSAGKSLLQLLDEFEALRRANLQILKSWNLTKTDLFKEGVHPEFGTVTLRQLLAAWVVHDLGHIRQIARVMAKQYTTEVGPWVAYMNVLNE